MPISNQSGIVSFDADASRRAIERTIDGPLRSLVEFASESFNPLYVDDVTLEFYEDESAMYTHFERIHSYVHVDFTERDLFTEELFPISDGVEYMATGLDVFTLVRVYVGEQGLFLAVDRDEPVEGLVAAIEDAAAN